MNGSYSETMVGEDVMLWNIRWVDDLTNRTWVKVELEKDANQFNLVGCVVGHMCQLGSYRVLGLMICFDDLTYSYEQ